MLYVALNCNMSRSMFSYIYTILGVRYVIKITFNVSFLTFFIKTDHYIDH